MGHLEDIVAASRKREAERARKLLWRRAMWTALALILLLVAWLVVLAPLVHQVL